MVLPTTVRDSGEALRYAVEGLHIWRLAMSGSTALKSSACTKRSASLSDRARRTPHSGNETDRASLEWKILAND